MMVWLAAMVAQPAPISAAASMRARRFQADLLISLLFGGLPIAA
jgi:hypothetical protein